MNKVYIGFKDKNGKKIYVGDVLYNEHDKYTYEIYSVGGRHSLGRDGFGLKSYGLHLFWEVLGNVSDGFKATEPPAEGDNKLKTSKDV